MADSDRAGDFYFFSGVPIVLAAVRSVMPAGDAGHGYAVSRDSRLTVVLVGVAMIWIASLASRIYVQ